MKRIRLEKALIVIMLCLGTTLNAQVTTIDVSTITEPQQLTNGEYVITGSNSGSDIAGPVFTIASGNKVKITLDNVNFKTNNTVATKFIFGASGSNASIVLKGNNVYDATAMKEGAALFSLGAGGKGTYNISEDPKVNGSITMKIGAANASFCVVSHWAKNGTLNISSGTFRLENTGTVKCNKGAVVAMGTNFVGKATISGGLFEMLSSGKGTNTGAVIQNFSGKSGGNICEISGGTFKAAGGYAIQNCPTENLTSKVNITGGSFSTSVGKKLFSAPNSSSNFISITGPVTIVNSDGASSKVADSEVKTLSAEDLSTYLTSMTVKK